MKILEYTTADGEIKTAILSHRIDANLFACKSSKRKRKNDIILHVSRIKTDVSAEPYEEEYGEDNTCAGMSQDEFDGLAQAGRLRLSFPEPTILVNN